MSQRVLNGIRVLDLTTAYAGSVAAKVLANLGAEVIKIESIQRIDMPFRRIGYPENRPDETQAWNEAGYFHLANAGKHGITLNLSDPRGVDVFKRLVSVSDIVMENFSPRVMRNFGLGYDRLVKVKPDLIMVSMCGYGQTGPHHDYVSYDPVMLARSGTCSITGYVGGPPTNPGIGYADWTLAMYGAAAALLALCHRDATGKGEHMDVSAQEALICHLGEFVLDYSINGILPNPKGNGDDFFAPHGIYRCKDRTWIAIAVTSEVEWHAFCTAAGLKRLIKEERFMTMAARLKHREELDKVVSCWSCEHDQQDVFHTLQTAGVPCGPVHNAKQIITDPQLLHRHFFAVVEHPDCRVGKRPHPTHIPAVFSRSSRFVPKAAPLLGEDNDRLLRDLLNMETTQITELEKDKVVGRTPDKFPPGQEKPLPIPLMVREGMCDCDPDYIAVLSANLGEPIGPREPRSEQEELSEAN